MLYSWITGNPQYRFRDTFLQRKRAVRISLSKSDKELGGPNASNNGKAAVFRLPREITAEIFKLTQLYDSKFWQLSDPPYNTWCWITITHICKQWRELALDTQDLWTHIDIGKLGVEQMAVYLARSGGSQLVVSYDYGRVSSFHRLYSILANIHRIRELHIMNIPGPCPDELRTALFHNAAPALRKFTLHIDYIDSNSQEVLDVKSLFQGQMPRLVGLSLYVNSPSWANNVTMRNLRELCICDRMHSFTLHDAFSILVENPNLEKFEVAFMRIDFHQMHSSFHAKPILLSFLKYIEFDTDYDVLHQLLKGIVTPNLLGWDVRTNYPMLADPGETDPKTMMPYISRGQSCTSLMLNIFPSDVKISADYLEHSIQDWDDNRPWQTLICLWDDEAQNPTIFANFLFICSAIRGHGGNWCSARELTVEIHTETSDNEDPIFSEDLGIIPWTTLLNMLPALQTLNVEVSGLIGGEDNRVQNTFRGLLNALKCTRTVQEGENCDAPIICPHIRGMNFNRMDLDAGVPHLANVLALRAVHGKKLHRLELNDFFGQEEITIRLLKSFGVDCEIRIHSIFDYA